MMSTLVMYQNESTCHCFHLQGVGNAEPRGVGSSWEGVWHRKCLRLWRGQFDITTFVLSAKMHNDVNTQVSKWGQKQALSQGVEVVVATPGRLIDLMQEGIISLAQVNHS